MCSYFKRMLDTMSRFKYITYAYESLAKWMAEGDEETKRLKRFIHRFLDIPETLPRAGPNLEDARELLIEFAHHYVSALLKYCSDDLKTGMCHSCLSNVSQSHTNTYTYTNTQGITSCPSGRRRISNASP